MTGVMQRVRALLSAREGGVALEFALIAPVLFTFYLGAVAMFDVLQAARQTSHTATIVNDLTSRLTTMDDAQRDSLYSTADALMTGWSDPTDYEISITSIVNPATENDDDEDDVDEYEVDWSEATSSSHEVETEDLINYDLPTIEDGASLILVEITGEYTPMFAVGTLQGSMQIVRTSVLRPRFASAIVYDD